MPAPPSNPLSMLRKLGTTLVGRDGLLTDAASTALGYSPMDRVKNRLAAQREVEGQMEFKNKIAQDARKAQADELALETNRYELDRNKAVNTREDAVRKAKGGVLAAARVPGPPNPDGSPIFDPDMAIGMAEGEAALNNLNRTSGQEVMTEGFAAMLGNLGINPGVEVGGKFDTSQMNSLLNAFNLDEGRKARLQAAREGQQARADARADANSFKERQLKDSIVGRISAALQSNEAYKKYVNVSAEANGLKALIRQAGNDPNGTSDIAIINMFQRLADPGVAVREGDVALIQSAQGLLPRVNNLMDWVNQGNRLAPETRANMLTLIDPIIEARAAAARENAIPFRNRARANRLDETEIFPEGFFPPDDIEVAPAAPGSPARKPTAEDVLGSFGIKLKPRN